MDDFLRFLRDEPFVSFDSARFLRPDLAVALFDLLVSCLSGEERRPERDALFSLDCLRVLRREPLAWSRLFELRLEERFNVDSRKEVM